MTPEQIIIAALGLCVLALGYGWWRAERRWLHEARAHSLTNRLRCDAIDDRDRLQAELTRLTDRDEKGRFVRREK